MGIGKLFGINGLADENFKKVLSSKDGVIRGHMLQMRAENSGRAVIVSIVDNKINECDIPIIMLQVLSRPEKVTKQNIEILQKLVNNGSKIYPGAKYIQRKEANRIKKYHPNGAQPIEL